MTLSCYFATFSSKVPFQIRGTKEESMRKKSVYMIVAVLIISAVLLSGCTDNKTTTRGQTGDAVATPASVSAAIPKVESLPQSDALNITAMAVRGGYPTSDSKKYQYEIDFFVKNEGNSDIVFDTAGLYFMVDDRVQPMVFLNTGPEKKWMIKPGETERIPTDSANLVEGGVALARSRGYNNLILQVVFFNNGQYINGAYGTLLPLVEDLPHESEGRGILLSFMLKVPQGSEEEANMAKFYEALPLPNNKMGKEVVPVATQKKVQPEETRLETPAQLYVVGSATYGISPMSDSVEYSIDVTVQNAGDKPVTFDKMKAYFDDQRIGQTVEFNAGTTTLEPGQATAYNFLTANAPRLISNVEAAGKKTVVMYVYLTNGGEHVGGEYSASLPPLDYLEGLEGKKHLLEFAKDSLPSKAK